MVGVDLNVGMLRLARAALVGGRVTYPRRRFGMVYDDRTVDVPVKPSSVVDFWACDVMALPFRERSAGAIFALNLLDCVPVPSARVRDPAVDERRAGEPEHADIQIDAQNGLV